jgi:hypothetical protein
VEGRNFWYSQLGHPGRIDEPKAIKWQASKRETPAELKYCTGKLDMYSIRYVISYSCNHTQKLRPGKKKALEQGF